MKKKLLVLIGLAFVLVITSTLGIAFANGALVPKKSRPSDYKVGITYQQAIENDKPMLVLFYANWCGYCLRFMPKFVVVNALYGRKYSVVMLDVEAPENQPMVKKAMLTGFPTLYIIDPKYDNQILLNSALYGDVSKLRVELDRYLRIRKLLDKATDKMDSDE
ncbi:MAG: protein disulfide isomerase family protein [Clostridiaceae bacterium]|jgi:thioredoxin 1|nr:protein disulfide isomerase family protein [Clostridiaceae bacterium]